MIQDAHHHTPHHYPASHVHTQHASPSSLLSVHHTDRAEGANNTHLAKLLMTAVEGGKISTMPSLIAHALPSTYRGVYMVHGVHVHGVHGVHCVLQLDVM